MKHSNFPMLRSTIENQTLFNDILTDIAGGQLTGKISATKLTQIDEQLSTMVYDGWGLHIKEPYFYDGKLNDLPLSIIDLDESLEMMTLYDVLDAHEQIKDVDTNIHESITLMKMFIAEVLPLAQAVNQLR